MLRAFVSAGKLIVSLWLLSWVCSNWGFAEELSSHPRRKVALLVGVDQYQKPGFENLNYAERDVIELEKVLREFGFETTVLLGSAKNEKQATAANIRSTLEKLVAPLGKQDLMLVALSGHGMQLKIRIKDRNGNEKEKEDGYFCAVDAVNPTQEFGVVVPHTDAKGRLNPHPKNQVSLSYVIDDVLAPNVGRKVVLIDACRNIPDNPGRGKGVEGKTITLPEETALLFSCRSGQQSFESKELKHGIFTYAVLEGLRGQAGRGDEVSWSEMVSYVNRRMSQQELKQYLPNGARQTPIPAGGLPFTILGKRVISSFVGKKAGDQKTLGSMKLKFCWCPAGSFTMGSPKSEKSRSSDEDQVKVTLTQGFWMGQHEVTQGLWEKVMSTTPWKGEDYVKEGANYAASYISHDDAVKFCEKLTKRGHQEGWLPKDWKVTLPTEAQWEYACRAGTTTAYHFGNDASQLGAYAWYDENAYDVDERYAHEVGQKKPNDWNLYDMHGNVYEWCLDWYDSDLPGGVDPEVTKKSSSRVIRGGGWYYFAGRCRSADRYYYSPEVRNSGLGFRTCIVPVQSH